MHRLLVPEEYFDYSFENFGSFGRSDLPEDSRRDENAGKYMQGL